MKQIALIFLYVFSINAIAARTYNVALVFDFKNHKNQSSLNQIRNEIESLSTVDIRIRQPKKYTYYVKNSAKNINKVLNHVYKNKKIHGVILMDFIGSSTANKRKKFPKPTISASVISAKYQGFKVRRNFNYLESPSFVSSNIKGVKKITGESHVSIVTTIDAVGTLKGVKKHLDREFQKLKMTYDFIHIKDYNYQEKLASVKDESTLLVGELLDFSDEEYREFITFLKKKKFRTFSLSSKKYVELGMLGSVYGDDLDYIQVARLSGLNMQRMFLGDNSRDLMTRVNRSSKVVLNLDTAKEIGFYPSWDAIMNAVVIRKKTASESLKLKEAILAVLSDNVDLKGSEATYMAEEANRMRSINKYLPQVNLVGSQKIIDKDSATAASVYGTNPEKQTVGTVSVDQLLLSDTGITNISISNSKLRVAKQQAISFKNDLIQDVSVTYLNVLRAKLLADIQLRNFKQTELNLKLARAKNRAGASRRTDVYRWESELATSKIQMIESRVEYKKKYAELNRLLNRPVTNRYKLEDIDHNHPMFFLFSHVKGVTNNPSALEALRDFVITESKKMSPIYLAAIENEELVKKTVGLANRSFFLPDVAVNFNYNKTFNRSGIGSTAPTGVTYNDNAWGASLNVTFPLITGGEKFSNRKEVVNNLVNASSRKRSLEFQLDTFVSNKIDDLFSQLSAIKLNKHNVKFAENNFTAVKDLYKNGKENIITVVDAQNNFLNASQNEVDSIYDFLTSYIQLGNLTGRYDFLLTRPEQEEMLKRLKSHYKN
jgi:outer membrane protein TolC